MATFDDIATNQQMVDIANAIRTVTRTTESMTIPQMPDRLLKIKVVETKDVSVNFSTASPLALETFSTAVQHLFIVSPKTSADAKLLQKVKPEIELAYDTETGVLSLAYTVSRDIEVDFLVVDLLLSSDDDSKGFLITSGGSSALELYDSTTDYDAGQMFLYNVGTTEEPKYTLAVTTSTHGAEAFDPAHNAVMATDINIEALSKAISKVANDLKSHVDDTSNPHQVTKSQVGLGNVDNTSDANKPVSTAQQAVFDTKVDKEEGKGLSTNDFSNSYKQQVESNTASRHTHANKSVLDQVEQPYKTAEKSKLEGIATGAQVNVIEKISVNGQEQQIEGKGVNISVPVNTSDLLNDSDYVSDKDYVHTDNNYTTQEKQKLASLSNYDDTEVRGNIETLFTSVSTAEADIAQNTADIVSNSNAINEINEKIPTQASKDNQLADKDFVNSSVNNLAAFYITKNAQRDPFETHAELFSATVFYSGGQPRTPTRNDYCIVRSDEEHENATTRYMYDVNGWAFQYIVNETPLTAEQLASINSGITESLVQQIGENTSSRHTHMNKSLLDTYSQTEANLSDAVAKKHSHNNKSVLDATTASFTTEQQTKLSGIQAGAQVNTVTSVNGRTGAVSGLAELSDIPTALSQLSQDTAHRTVTDAEKTTWNNKSDFSGSYSDLLDKPSIPTVNDGTLTIKQGGVSKGTFSANQSGNVTVDLDEGGGVTLRRWS